MGVGIAAASHHDGLTGADVGAGVGGGLLLGSVASLGLMLHPQLGDRAVGAGGAGVGAGIAAGVIAGSALIGEG